MAKAQYVAPQRPEISGFEFSLRFQRWRTETAGLDKLTRVMAAGLAKAFLRFASRRVYNWEAGLPGERDYGRMVGNGDGNSIVSACVQWVARTFPEAPPALWRVNQAGVRTRIMPAEAGPGRLLTVLRFPTAGQGGLPRGFYSGVVLWMATLTSRLLDGNAYWLKTRNGYGAVTGLWYVPHWMMEPRWPDDGRTFIGWYDYMVDGQTFQVPPSDVIHFRHGLDPNNPRKGRSPLHAVLREVYTDEEAARFSASILKNLGMPGLVISPATGGGSGAASYRMTEPEAEKVKTRFMEKFGGDRRGEPLVLSLPAEVRPFGFSPQELDLSALRNIPEERVTAAVGLPAAVVGFGAGLQQTKVGATMAELRDSAWQSNLMPTQREMGEELAVQLLPDFALDTPDIEFGFDLSRVAILQDHMTKMAETWRLLVSSGIARRSEARSRFDLPWGPEDDVYLPQPGVMPVPADGRPAPNGNMPSANMPSHQMPEAQPAA